MKKKVLVVFLIAFVSAVGFVFTRGYDVGDDYFGFELVAKEEIDDIDCTAYTFKHKKTNANLMYLENEDDNKVFSIAFKTIPKDDTGVNHIIEHSVLCGSQKYPVKDPFLQLKKSSLNTYLNALTYKDKTMYPVSSKNDKDLKNLMSVYLDAVFFPKAIENENIFRQEGIRYELENISGNINATGIVFNEMKGAYSSQTRVLLQSIYKSLYPNNCYKFDSGGNPRDIKNLTYNEFVSTYKENYHPSNSYIYLYGDLNLNSYLKKIDKEYLSRFDKKDIKEKMLPQNPFLIPRDEIHYYPSSDNKNYLSINYAIGDVKDKKNIFYINLLNQLLFIDNSFENYLVDKRLCTNIETFIDSDLKQPFFSIVLENVDGSKRAEIQSEITKYFTMLVNNKIPKEKLDACLNMYKINTENAKINPQRGINYNEDIMKVWMYGYDPTLYLKINDVIKNMNENGLKDAININLLENKHMSMVLLKGTNFLQNNFSISLDEFSNDQLRDLVSQTKEFKTWQNTSDSPEDLATIPKLKIKDVPKRESKIDVKKSKYKDTVVLENEVESEDIVYNNFYFDIKSLNQEQIPYLHLLVDLMFECDSENYSNDEIKLRLKSMFSHFGFNIDAVSNYDNYKQYCPFLMMSFGVVESENYKNQVEIVKEMLNNVKLDDEKNIYKCINQIKCDLQSRIITKPLGTVMGRCQSYFNEKDRYLEEGNIEYYKFILDLCRDFENKKLEIIKNLNDVYNICFNQNNLITSISGESDDCNDYKNNAFEIIDSIKNQQFKDNNYQFENYESEMFGSDDIGVQYIAKGINYMDYGFKYNPTMSVLKSVINDGYLWNEIRVKGGAYGGGFEISKDGNMIFYSHNDPNLLATLKVFDNAGEYIKNLDITKDELNDFVISTIGERDRLKSCLEIAMDEDYKYISGEPKIENKERKSILEATENDIKSYYKLLQLINEKQYESVIGNKQKIRSDGFEIKNLIN